MSCGSTCTKPHTHPQRPAEAVPHLPSPAQVIASWCTALVALQLRWRQREELLELDDRILRDIGLTREQIERQARRWLSFPRRPRA